MTALGFEQPKEERKLNHSARVMPVTRSSATGLRKTQGIANPLGITGYDAENPLHIPPVQVATTRPTFEQGHEDSDVFPREPMSVLTFLKIITAISAVYVSASTWFLFYDPDKKQICPRTVICATNTVELTLLTFSRLSAGVLWASITIVLFTKCYATRSFLHNSWFGAVIDFEPTHDAHTYFGYLTLIAGLEHGVLHCIRFIYSHNAWLIYETDVGRSGMVVCILLLPIVLPMKFDFFKTKMTFQTRKNMHMLFLAMLVALCFHSMTFRYVGSIHIVWYILDRLYFTTKQTFLITHPIFEAVGRGTMVGLDLPAGYTFKAGSYIYVNSPTISRSEWHPFSIIQVPGNPPRAAFYAEAVGDWTQELFRLGLEQPRLPLWITAAQPSLMEKSIYYDNIVLVCTGAGITPAVSIVERFANRKNIHLMWMSRDGGMIALFEKQLRKVNSTVHLTGKQTRETKDALERLLVPPREESDSSDSEQSFGGSIKSFANRLAAIRRVESDHSVSGFPPELKALHSRGTAEEYFRLGYHNSVAVDRGTHKEEKEDSASLPVEVLDSLPENKLNRDEQFPKSQRRKSRIDKLLSQRRRPSVRSNVGAPPPLDPVTLTFGRPRIGKYLAETFASKTRSCGGDNFDVSATSQSAKASAGASRPRRKGRETSTRLDISQRISKEMLMEADAKVVKACQKNGKQQSSSADGTPQVSRSFPESGGPDTVSSSRLPWIVLYCGANPRVEEAIAKVCDDLKVNWQKEYFGAW